MENKNLYDVLIENRHNPDVSDEEFILVIDMYMKFKKKRFHFSEQWLDNVGLNEIVDYCKDGNKLAAVKLVKELSGMGLKEAKDWIDERFNALKEGHI